MANPIPFLNERERKAVKNCLERYVAQARRSAERTKFYSVSPDIDPERVNHALSYCLDSIEKAITEGFKELESGRAG